MIYKLGLTSKGHFFYAAEIDLSRILFRFYHGMFSCSICRPPGVLSRVVSLLQLPGSGGVDGALSALAKQFHAATVVRRDLTATLVAIVFYRLSRRVVPALEVALWI
jgi:hypothetical protein